MSFGFGFAGTTSQFLMDTLTRQLPNVTSATGISLDTKRDVHLVSTEAQLKDAVTWYDSSRLVEQSNGIHALVSTWCVAPGTTTPPCTTLLPTSCSFSHTGLQQTRRVLGLAHKTWLCSRGFETTTPLERCSCRLIRARLVWPPALAQTASTKAFVRAFKHHSSWVRSALVDWRTPLAGWLAGWPGWPGWLAYPCFMLSCFAQTAIRRETCQYRSQQRHPPP